MATFVHLAPASLEERIRVNGLKADRRTGGVFAMPVVPNFMTTYSWSREMLRHRGRLVAVHFKVPDREPVRIGHYATPSEMVTAAEAVGIVRDLPDAHGFQIVVSRSISSRDVTRIRAAPRVGWRFSPTAKGTVRARCPCPVCRTRGEMGEASIRRNIIEAALAPPDATDEEQVAGLIDAMWRAHELAERQVARQLFRRLQGFVATDDPALRYVVQEGLVALAGCLHHTRGFDPERELDLLAEQLAGEADPRLRALAVQAQVHRADWVERHAGDPGAALDLYDAVIRDWGDDPSEEVRQVVEDAVELAADLRERDQG